MKIGIVCYPSVGGSGVLATELGHQLALRGHEIHFITYERPFRLQLQGNIHFHEVLINQYDLFKYPDYALTLAAKMAQVAKDCSLDLLHVHYAIPHATSAYLAKQMCGIPIVTTLHGTDITLVGQQPEFFEVVKFSIEQSDNVTTVSHSLKKETQETFSITRPIEVIHNFFVPEEVTPIPLAKEPVILHLSNYRPPKRFPDVLETFRKVRAKLPCKLALLGGGPALEGLAPDPDIILLGRRQEVDPYLAAADILLLPSSHESFGLAALEAMAYGVPPVTSDIGGLPELIEHGKSGYLCPVGDTDQMAAHILHLLEDKQAHAQMSQAARTRALTHFSADQIVPQYEKLYKC